MHLAEGTLPLGQALAWGAATVPVLLWSLAGERAARAERPATALLVTGATSLLFAATLLPLPVPVVGATSHICATPLLALLLGLRRVVWPTFFVLVLQALFFAHGGITTLGVNTLTLGLLGPAVAVGVWAALGRLGLRSATALGATCATGGLAVYVFDAAALGAGLAEAAPPAATFTAVVLGFAPVQVPLALLEAAASVGVVRVLAERRPDLLPPSLTSAVRGPSPRGLAGLLVALVTLASLPGCTYEGIDGTVFGAAAEAAGRPPRESLVDLSQGELGLATSTLVLFGLGFAAGRAWERLAPHAPAPHAPAAPSAPAAASAATPADARAP